MEGANSRSKTQTRFTELAGKNSESNACAGGFGGRTFGVEKCDNIRKSLLNMVNDYWNAWLMHCFMFTETVLDNKYILKNNHIQPKTVINKKISKTNSISYERVKAVCLITLSKTFDQRGMLLVSYQTVKSTFFDLYSLPYYLPIYVLNFQFHTSIIKKAESLLNEIRENNEPFDVFQFNLQSFIQKFFKMQADQKKRQMK
ncbi:Hypothetical_protein [Hexamita inflata]|uniref:Hypothetical_protein n=1 Tax=Hexamita inflata TaxID=28002 RepID=A0ABP1H8Z8_9EUKA